MWLVLEGSTCLFCLLRGRATLIGQTLNARVSQSAVYKRSERSQIAFIFFLSWIVIFYIFYEFYIINLAFFYFATADLSTSARPIFTNSKFTLDRSVGDRDHGANFVYPHGERLILWHTGMPRQQPRRGKFYAKIGFGWRNEIWPKNGIWPKLH